MTKVIENMKEYVAEQLANGAEPELYAKTARVQAHPGKPGEKIVTKMKNGLEETTNIVQEGDMVLTNPDGEQYIVKKETFEKKYEIDPENPKQFRPKGGAQEFITVTEDIEFTAPWGEKMTILAGGALNISGRDSGDIYGIQKDEFNSTYDRCDKDGNILQKIKANLLQALKKATPKDSTQKLNPALLKNTQKDH